MMDFTEPRVMGILNVTPDSFYDSFSTSPPLTPCPLFPLSNLERGTGGEVVSWQTKAEALVQEGAYIIDIGAVSTRPGAAEVSEEEEKTRLMPVLKETRKNYPEMIISIDTYRAEIARMAAGEGADMINDISGGTFDPQMIPCIIDLKIPYVIMHIQGVPGTMQADPVYNNVTEEVFGFLLNQAKQMEDLGHDKLILDPGFGFGKTVEHNYSLLASLDKLAKSGFPILAGLSRKSMINRVLGTKPAEALNGTTVLNTIALLKGSSILRVHDVREAVEALELVGMVNRWS